MKSLVNLVFISFLIAGIYTFYLEPKFNKPSLPDISKAATYEIVKMSENFSFPGRIRHTWTVSTAAVGQDSIKQTAMKAAIDIQKDTAADVIQIYLVRGEADQAGLASIFYAADGKGRSGDQDWTWDGGLLGE